MHKTSFKLQVGSKPVVLHQFISQETGFSADLVQDIIRKGAVWLVQDNRAKTRLKDVRLMVEPGAGISVYYDESLYVKDVPQSECLEDLKQYSIWFKPSGLLTQGNLYGDYFSLQWQIEQELNKRKVFIVHRLDFEVSGVVIVAHTKKLAAVFSKMFQQHNIVKTYRARMLGRLEEQKTGIDLPLDGKQAFTEFEVLKYDEASNTSIAEVQIKTGRFHQIRRHFDLIGHPLIGDPKYGRDNKNRSGLQLQAIRLEFRCPLTQEIKKVMLPEQKISIG